MGLAYSELINFAGVTRIVSASFLVRTIRVDLDNFNFFVALVDRQVYCHLSSNVLCAVGLRRDEGVEEDSMLVTYYDLINVDDYVVLFVERSVTFY